MNTAENFSARYFIHPSTPAGASPSLDAESKNVHQTVVQNFLERTPDADGFDYSLDDGKISAQDKIKNLAKGIIKPITAMFSSPKNFIIGAAGILGGAALITATGGAAAPVMVALGVAGGGLQIAKSAYQAHNAKTDAEAENAWQGMGTGTTAVAGSVLGSKSALKGAGIDAKGGFLSSTLQCFKSLPSQISGSLNAFKTGAFVGSFKNAFKLKENKKTGPDKNPDTTAETKPQDSKSQNAEAQKPVSQETQNTNNAQQSKVQKTKPSEAKTPDGEPVELEWNDNGTIKKSTIKGSDGTTIKHYDENGKIQFIETKEAKYQYLRDDKGRIAKIKADTPEGEVIFSEYVYDKSGGRLIRQSTYDSQCVFDYTYDPKTGKHTSTAQTLEIDSKGVISRNVLEKKHGSSDWTLKEQTIVDAQNSAAPASKPLTISMGDKPVKVGIVKDNAREFRLVGEDGKAYAYMEAYEDSFFNACEFDVPGYVDAQGTIKGLHINCLASGAKGSGAGTQMIKGAVQTSKDMGLGGRVYLQASITDKAAGTPVPFYAKLGFKAIDPALQSEIAQAMTTFRATGTYSGPKDAMMYLPLDKVSEFLN